MLISTHTSFNIIGPGKSMYLVALVGSYLSYCMVIETLVGPELAR